MMKKLYLFTFSLIILFTVNCNEKNKSNDATIDSNFLKGETIENIHFMLGEPTGGLSGLWGDIYELKNGTAIVIYYDQSGKVELVKTSNLEN